MKVDEQGEITGTFMTISKVTWARFGVNDATLTAMLRAGQGGSGE